MKASKSSVSLLSSLLLTSALTSLLPSAAQAKSALETAKALGFKSTVEMEQYLTLSDVSIVEIANPTNLESAESLLADSNSIAEKTDARIQLGNDALDSLGSVIANPYSPKAWVTFGKKAWEIVIKNEPVLNVSSRKVSILPAAATNWAQMENWQTPIAKTYKITARNGYGIDAISHAYTVSYNWGGQLNDHGAYLANATIIPTAVSVAWGYTLNSGVEVGSVLNTGTKENPVPGVDLNLNYSISTILKKSQGIDAFFVRGDGKLTHTTKL